MRNKTWLIEGILEKTGLRDDMKPAVYACLKIVNVTLYHKLILPKQVSSNPVL